MCTKLITSSTFSVLAKRKRNPLQIFVKYFNNQLMFNKLYNVGRETSNHKEAKETRLQSLRIPKPLGGIISQQFNVIFENKETFFFFFIYEVNV